MRFDEILQGVVTLSHGGDPGVEIRGVAYDSRRVEQGFLFVAVRGFQVDGHEFVSSAIERGAVAVVVEEEASVPPGVAWALVRDGREALALLAARFYGEPAQKLTMVGVTGTNGKTTTTCLIAAVLEAAGKKTGLLGTIHNRIGNRIIPGSHTTPESRDLQELLKEMVDEGVDACVMEVSSHALALSRVVGCEFDLALFTNLTQDHLDLHHTMENYLAAKLKLFRELQNPGAKGRVKLALINTDDPAAGSFIAAAQEAGARICTYGIDSAADVRAKGIDVNSRGASFDIDSPFGSCRLELSLTGRFNVYNSLSAFAAAGLLEVPVPVIKEALEQIKEVPGRFTSLDEGQDFTVIVDYAHTPDGLENTLSTARRLTDGRVITVYGCGGDRDRDKRPQMGKIAAQYSDFQIVTADNPRSEDQKAIAEDIMTGVRQMVGEEYYLVEPDRRKAIYLAVNMARPGDLVMIAGKGHEDYQIVGKVKHHFDDAEVAREALRNHKLQITNHK